MRVIIHFRSHWQAYLLNLLFGFLLLTGHTMAANAVGNNDETITSGEFRLLPLSENTNSENPSQHQIKTAQLEKTEVNIDVNGMIARVIVKQTFKNNSDEWSEGEYVFPLPTNSAVDYMAMQIGKRRIVGTIQEKERAKLIYQQAKSAGKKASLITQQRPNLFTNKVANIPPKESISVELHYVETLHYDQGRFSLRVPTTITPRYIPGVAFSNAEVDGSLTEGGESQETNKAINLSNGWATATDLVPDAPEITPPMAPSESAEKLILSAVINPGFKLSEIKSLYHLAEKKQFGDIYKLTLDANARLDKDVVLEWTPTIGSAPIAAVFKESIIDDDYFLLMIMPPQKISQQQVLPKETIFIIDTSGSMAGTSITQARNALISALTRLKSNDRFNIIEFNSNYHSLFSDPVDVTSETLLKAEKFVSNLNADGGTEMASALQAAFSNKITEGYIRQIIFITDGSVGNEDLLFNLIKNKRGNSRLFTVGIGSAPNSHFMQKAAEAGQGSFTYIGEATDIQKNMADLFYKLEMPIMTNININFENSGSSKNNIEFFPKVIPDLYAGEPLIVAVRKTNYVDSNYISISGSLSNNEFNQRLNIQNNKPAKSISKLWARKKLADLYDQERHTLYDTNNEDTKIKIKQDITDLALNHNLLSKYTSFVAVEEKISRPNNQNLAKTKIPNAMPSGSAQAIPMPSSGLGLNTMWLSILLCSLVLLFMNYTLFLNRYRIFQG